MTERRQRTLVIIAGIVAALFVGGAYATSKVFTLYGNPWTNAEYRFTVDDVQSGAEGDYFQWLQVSGRELYSTGGYTVNMEAVERNDERIVYEIRGTSFVGGLDPSDPFAPPVAVTQALSHAYYREALNPPRESFILEFRKDGEVNEFEITRRGMDDYKVNPGKDNFIKYQKYID